MEVVLMQISEKFPSSQISLMDRSDNVVLDVESLAQLSDKCCSGSPRMTRVLSRKGSSRIERRAGEDQEADEASNKLVIKVIPSQFDHLKQPLAVLADSGDGRNKKTDRFTAIHPRKILLFFATMSSMGTMILIYFTLAINRRGASLTL